MNVCEWSQESQASASHTLCRLQPIAHLASMEYPLNVSLYSLSTHHGSRFAQLVRPHKLSSVGMLYSRFPFQNLVQTVSVVLCARCVRLCDPDSFVFVFFPVLHHTFQKYLCLFAIICNKSWGGEIEPRWRLQHRLVSHVVEFVFS